MTTLNARFVKQARKEFWCDECNRAIVAGTPYIRMYGMADVEKPWTLRYHARCIEGRYKTDEALTRALEAAQRHSDEYKQEPKTV